MKPETLPELITTLIVAAIAVLSSIALKMDWVTHSTFFAVMTCLGAAASAFFGVRHYIRAKPYFFDIKRESWKIISNAKKPVGEFTHREVAVVIPEKTHKKGRYPRVEFVPDDLGNYTTTLVYTVSDKGDVSVFHSENSFMWPYAPKLCRVRISPN